jgi:hypothetical protein
VAKGKAKSKPKRELVDRRLARAISHPLRVEIMVEALRAPISPNEYVERRGGVLSNTAYHFRQLEKLGCLAVVDEVKRRGAVEHFYDITKRALLSDEDFARLPAPLQGGFNASIFSTFMQQGQEALEADTMDSRENKHLSWTPVKLDRVGFDRIMGMMGEVYRALGVEQMAAAGRMKKTGEPPIYTTVGLFGFESPEPKRRHEVKNKDA